MHNFEGHVDLTNLGDVSGLAHTEQGAWSTLEGPGLKLRWQRGLVDVADGNGVFALSSGRARAAQPHSAPHRAPCWLEDYARDGDDAASLVGGGFAIAIIDTRRKKVVLSVDRFSIETLCYRRAGDEIVFADSASATAGCSAANDEQSLYDYFYFHVIPSPKTLFRDVARLPGGHSLIASIGSHSVRRYWKPRFIESDATGLERRKDQFRTILLESVRQESDDDATACFLSGGTDSSTIAGMLTRLRGKPAHAYSIGFEAEGYDEMAFARIAARHFGLVHNEHYVKPEDLVVAIPRIAAWLDQPFGNSSIVPTYYCAMRAAEDGFTRLLAGDGGDELFGGNTRYATQKLLDLYDRVPGWLRRSTLVPLSTNKRFGALPGLRRVAGYVRYASPPMPDRLESFNLLNRMRDLAIFERDFLEGVDMHRPLARQRDVWNDLDATSLVNRMLAYDWKFTLGDSDLPKVRAATQLAGTTVGYPFLSREMTDFSLSIPPAWKLNGLRLRWFFKEALREFLPREILRKKKHGFGLPFGVWTLRHAALRAFVEDALHGMADRRIVRRAFVDELMQRRLPEAPGYYGEMAWLLLMLEHWLRAHGPAGGGKPILRLSGPRE